MRSFLVASLLVCVSLSAYAEAPHSLDEAGVALAERRILAGLENGVIESPSQIVVVYFTPKDHPPAKDHVARVRRIVQTTADFYHQELERHGFANRTMNLFRGDDGEIAIIDVTGADQDYGKPDGGKIRDEIVPVLRQRGINPRESVLLMFCNLMDYDAQNSKISHHSPYYGGGSYLSGNAWQCDSEILDPLRFKDSTPIRDGEYGKITIGKHNSIFIGGVIHELGHALSLPHCKQRSDEAVRGTALMGSGNRTFRQELRGEGRGTFLTQAHALRLAAHPVFRDRVSSSLRNRPQTNWDELKVDVASDNTIRIRGRVSAKVPIHGIAAYFDPTGGSDYNATTATAVTDAAGRFELRSGKLEPNRSGQLRLVTCHINGATSKRAFEYRIDASGRPDLSSIRLQLELSAMIDALREGDLGTATKQLDRIAGDDQDLKQIGDRVLKRFRERGNKAPASIDLSAIPATTPSVALSSVKPTFAKVGWLKPAYDRVPDQSVLLSLGGDFFACGIYAHAPAKHVYQVSRSWKRLSGQCGLQAGHPGKVDFEIVGDGKLLWNQRGAAAGQTFAFDLDVASIDRLSLIVTEGGNGAGADWGVWIEPMLTR